MNSSKRRNILKLAGANGKVRAKRDEGIYLENHHMTCRLLMTIVSTFPK